MYEWQVFEEIQVKMKNLTTDYTDYCTDGHGLSV